MFNLDPSGVAKVLNLNNDIGISHKTSNILAYHISRYDVYTGSEWGCSNCDDQYIKNVTFLNSNQYETTGVPRA